MSNTSDRDAAFWQQRYTTGDLPWDSRVADHEIFDRFDALNLPRGIGLDVGCGAGTHAIELVRRGWEVYACDIASAAIEQARARAQQAGVDVHWSICDLTQQAPTSAASVDFAFDRGCLHSINVNQRASFVANLAASLKPGAYWLSLCGNADDIRRTDEMGPPQMTAATLVSVVEPLFEVIQIERAELGDQQKQAHLAWAGLFRKRSV